MKRALITIATVGILAPTAWVGEANAQYMGGAPAPAYSAAPAYGPSQRYAPSRRYARRAYRRSARQNYGAPPAVYGVIRPSPLALVGRPMPLLLNHMPQTLPSRMNGTPLPAL
jgi:hypothetical protein